MKSISSGGGKLPTVERYRVWVGEGGDDCFEISKTVGVWSDAGSRQELDRECVTLTQRERIRDEVEGGGATPGKQDDANINTINTWTDHQALPKKPTGGKCSHPERKMEPAINNGQEGGGTCRPLSTSRVSSGWPSEPVCCQSSNTATKTTGGV